MSHRNRNILPPESESAYIPPESESALMSHQNRKVHHCPTGIGKCINVPPESERSPTGIRKCIYPTGIGKCINVPPESEHAFSHRNRKVHIPPESDHRNRKVPMFHRNRKVHYPRNRKLASKNTFFLQVCVSCGHDGTSSG